MLRKVVRICTQPGRYIPLALKIAQQPLCYLFRGAPFFFQSQMDVHPKSRWHNPNFVSATGGFYLSSGAGDRHICNLEPWDTTRRDMLILLLRTIVDRAIEGDFAELGVYRGATAKLLHHYAPERNIHLFDTFQGFTGSSVRLEQEHTGLTVGASHFADTSLAAVKNHIAARNDHVFFHPGYFPESIPNGFDALRFAFVHLDADLYEPTRKGLEFFYPRVTRGGMLVVHDYNAWPGARKAVDDFFADKNEFPIPMPDKSGSALVIKQ